MSIVKDALIAEIKEKAELSQEYYNIIQEAKTKTKKKLYQKKLAEHNNVLADLIISLDKLNNSEYNSQDTNKNGNNNNDECEQAGQS
jgi:predicted component of viral defense system (DUF524 family)